MNKKILLFIFSCIATNVAADFVNDKNSRKISEIDVEVLLETAPVKAQKGLLQNKKKLTAQLEQLYLKKVLSEQAVKEGLDKEPMNAARLQTILDNALFLLKLDAVKRSNNKDYTKFAKQVYKVKKSEYRVDERIDAAHILITTKEMTAEQALEKITKIRKELMLGADFSEVALRESGDKSVKRNKGELGAFTRAQLVKEFTDAAFSMKPGELSEPVKTTFGYHLIKLNKKIPAGIKTFDEVKEGIIAELKEKDWDVDRAEYYSQIKKNNEMEIDEEALDAFVAKKLAELDGEK